VRYPYLVVDNNNGNIYETLQKFERFPEFFCVGTTSNVDEAVEMVLEHRPRIIFTHINLQLSNERPFFIIAELHRYLNILPYFVAIGNNTEFAYAAIKAGVSDYLVQPLSNADLTKCFYRMSRQFSAEHSHEMILPAYTAEPQKPALSVSHPADGRICIKSYGDYQFISLSDIIYLKADNNTTDFFLHTGRRLTAYKTLKYYETSLPGNFYRIHNSYIVNSNYITRISTGKSLCYFKNNEISVPFSKTHKDIVDAIIKNISPEYL